VVCGRKLQRAVVQIEVAEKARNILDEGRLNQTLAYLALRVGLHLWSQRVPATGAGSRGARTGRFGAGVLEHFQARALTLS
jgi:hypothetical protein